MDNVLRFTLPGSSGDNEASWKYSLAELRELQNKLMLMSTKGEQGLEVEKFSEVRFQTQWVTDVEAGVAFCLEYQLLGLWFTAELLGTNSHRQIDLWFPVKVELSWRLDSGLVCSSSGSTGDAPGGRVAVLS